MRKLPWAEIIVIALVIAAGAGLYVYAHRDEGALAESKERGAALVAALQAYEREHGTYPRQLEDLVPEYVAAVEPPTWGLERWRYRMYTPDDVTGPTVTTGESVSPGEMGPPDPPARSRPAPSGLSGETPSRVYFQLSVAADPSGYPVLYYDFATDRWVLNN